MKVPAPPLQVPLLALPPTTPASVTAGLLAHTVWSAPAFTVAAGLIVIVIVSLTARHGPVGSSVVNVNVTVPAVASPADGVYTAFNVVVFGLKVPAPPLHVPLLALPPMIPASVTADPAQTV